MAGSLAPSKWYYVDSSFSSLVGFLVPYGLVVGLVIISAMLMHGEFVSFSVLVGLSVQPAGEVVRRPMRRFIKVSRYLEKLKKQTGGEPHFGFLKLIEVGNNWVNEVRACGRTLRRFDCWEGHGSVWKPISCGVRHLCRRCAERYRKSKTAEAVADLDVFRKKFGSFGVMHVVLMVSKYQGIRDFISGVDGTERANLLIRAGIECLVEWFSKIQGEAVQLGGAVCYQMCHSNRNLNKLGDVTHPLLENYPHLHFLLYGLGRTGDGRWLSIGRYVDLLKWKPVLAELWHERLSKLVGRPVGIVIVNYHYADAGIHGGKWGIERIRSWFKYFFRPSITDIGKYLEQVDYVASPDERKFALKLVTAGGWQGGRGKGYKFHRWFGWMADGVRTKRVAEIGIVLLSAKGKLELAGKFVCDKCGIPYFRSSSVKDVEQFDESEDIFDGYVSEREMLDRHLNPVVVR